MGNSVALHRQTNHRGNAARPTATRHTAWVEIAALVLIAALLLAGALYNSGSLRHDTPSTQVRVEHGETLWALASAHPVAGQSTEQTAELIAELNGLDSGTVVAGTVIRIPAGANGDSGLALAMR
jgi:LysM repeat protein